VAPSAYASGGTGQDRERETGGCGWQDVSLESSVPVQPSLRAMTFP